MKVGEQTLGRVLGACFSQEDRFSVSIQKQLSEEQSRTGVSRGYDLNIFEF